MGCGDTINLAGTETREERKCARCGAQSWLAHVLLDSRKGVAVRIFECRCVSASGRVAVRESFDLGPNLR